jgi:hypothetical protein
MNTIAESSSRAEIKKVRTPPCDDGRILCPERAKVKREAGFGRRIEQDGPEWWNQRLQDYAAPVRSEFTEMFQALSSHSGT